jgi:hypothetical protein
MSIEKTPNEVYRFKFQKKDVIILKYATISPYGYKINEKEHSGFSSMAVAAARAMDEIITDTTINMRTEYAKIMKGIS